MIKPFQRTRTVLSNAIRISLGTICLSLAVTGCSQAPTATYTSVADPARTVTQAESIVSSADIAVPEAAIEITEAAVAVETEPQPAVADDDSRDEAPAAKSEPTQTPPDRVRGLAQRGGGMGGGMGGMGGMGGGMGGMGGGMGGMGGGGMGGMMGGGMGGGGGGGVSIDPKIQLKRDSSGKLETLRRDATGTKPKAGSFSN